MANLLRCGRAADDAVAGHSASRTRSADAFLTSGRAPRHTRPDNAACISGVLEEGARYEESLGRLDIADTDHRPHGGSSARRPGARSTASRMLQGTRCIEQPQLAAERFEPPELHQAQREEGRGQRVSAHRLRLVGRAVLLIPRVQGDVARSTTFRNDWPCFGSILVTKPASRSNISLSIPSAFVPRLFCSATTSRNFLRVASNSFGLTSREFTSSR